MVFSGQLVKASVVDTESEGAVLLLDEENTSANQPPPAQCLHKLAQSHRSHRKVPTITEFGRVVWPINTVQHIG